MQGGVYTLHLHISFFHVGPCRRHHLFTRSMSIIPDSLSPFLLFLSFFLCFQSALDTRLSHPDEVLTSSLSSFTILVASLFSSFLKPLVDIVFLSRTLIKHLGVGAPLTLVGWYILTALAMHAVAPPLGKKTARLQELEGKYRGRMADGFSRFSTSQR